MESILNSALENRRIMLVGSTGAVGREVLRLALADARVSKVVAPTRRPLNDTHIKLENPVLDFAQLPPEAEWWDVDAVICTLGTTIRTAGSQAAFAAVDRDLPIRIARLAKQAGATRFALNSSLGAHPKGNFYLRTKAEAEQGIRDLGYPGFVVVRPSLIDTRRAARRPGERIGLCLARILRPLIPPRYRAVKAEAIARALLEAALSPRLGEQIIESEQLQD
jgi:uncharacterized protein YbjT (DUF2867 family)